MLRDVREGVEPVPDTRRLSGAAGGAGSTPGPGTTPDSHELLSAIIGKSFVIVPAAAIVAFGLWTGYEQGVESGLSTSVAVLLSIASLAATIGGAFVWASMSRKKS